MNGYVEGFGKLDDGCIFINIYFILAFWLGLEKMHALTIEPKTMRVDLWYNDEYAFAEYDGFVMGINQHIILLIITATLVETAGDSFYYHKGIKFSTYDNNHDNYYGRCTTSETSYTGGWWMNRCTVIIIFYLIFLVLHF